MLSAPARRHRLGLCRTSGTLDERHGHPPRGIPRVPDARHLPQHETQHHRSLRGLCSHVCSGWTSRIADTVFNVSTEKLPGGDNLTNEGILGFFIAGFFAVWLGGTAVKTFAVMIGFFFTAAKYFAMGIALVLIGIAAS